MADHEHETRADNPFGLHRLEALDRDQRFNFLPGQARQFDVAKEIRPERGEMAAG